MSKKLSLIISFFILLGITIVLISTLSVPKVTFKVEGEVYYHGRRYHNLVEPEIEGYEFKGWFYNDEPFDIKEVSQKKITVLAVFEILKFKVYFDSEYVVVNYNQTVTPLEKTLEYFEFDGWYLNDELFDFKTKITSELHLESKFTPIKEDCEIIYDPKFEFDEENILKTTSNENSVNILEMLQANENCEIFIYLDENYQILVEGEIELNIGDNLFYCVIRSKNGSFQKEYVINVYKPNTYTILVDEEIYYVFENEVLNITPKEILGYDFLGYFCNDELFDLDTPINEDLILVSKYTPKTFVINYLDKQLEINYDDDFILEIEEKEHYQFKGYRYEDEFITDEFGNSLNPFTLLENITLEAVYTAIEYNITYEIELNTTNPNPLNFTIEDEITLIELDVFGYTFLGFYYENNKITQINQNSLETISDITLIAKFELIEYKITYLSVFGENLNPTSYTITSSDIILNKIDRTGYKFLGFYHNEELFDSIKTGSFGDLVLECRYEIINYTITYIDEFNSVNKNKTTYNINDDSFTLIEPNLNGFTFLGFYLDEQKVTSIDTSMAIDITIKLKFKVIEYTLSFTDYKEVKYTVLDEVIFEPLSKDGYTFLGWFNTSNQLVQKIEKNTTGNYTFTAKWELTAYKIEYLDAPMHSNPVTFDIFTSFELSDPIKNGYTFDGWYKDNKLITTIEENTTTDLIITAKWIINTYTITYQNTLNALNTNPTLFTVEDVIELIPLEKTGYKFLGFFIGEEEVKTIQNTFNNLEFNCRFELIEYKVNFSCLYEITYPNITKYTILDAFINLDALEIDGYLFDGFYLNNQKIILIETTIASDIVIEIKLTPIEYQITIEEDYFITFDDGLTQITVNINEIDSILIPSKAGYVFNGWMYNNQIFEFNEVIEHDITLNAYWVEVNERTDTFNILIDQTKEIIIAIPIIQSGIYQIYTDNSIDTVIKLTNHLHEVLAFNDDTTTSKSAHITYPLKAGNIYYAYVSGYSQSVKGSVNLLIEKSFEVDLKTNTKSTKSVSYDQLYTLDYQEIDGYTFIGYFNNDTQYTDASGNSLNKYKLLTNLFLQARYKKNEYTLEIYETSSKTYSYNQFLDLTPLTKDGYSFSHYSLTEDGEKFDFAFMPSNGVVLYPVFIPYDFLEFKYKQLDYISIHSDDEVFEATIYDTDNNKIPVVIEKTLNGSSYNIVLKATSKNVTKTHLIENILVYKDPTLEINSTRNYISMNEVLDKDTFNIVGYDSFNQETEIRLTILDENYSGGSIVSILVEAIDITNNITSKIIENVYVYDTPTIIYNQITAIKKGAQVNFNAIGYDSFNKQLDVKVTLLEVKDHVYLYELKAIDIYSNEVIIQHTVYEYLDITINYNYINHLKLSSEINATNLNIEAFDSFNQPLELEFTKISGDLKSGSIVEYQVKATDPALNTKIVNINIYLYGTPTIQYHRNTYNIGNEVDLDAVAYDSFYNPLKVTYTLDSTSTLIGGRMVYFRIKCVDRVLNEAEIVTSEIYVYDILDIAINYNYVNEISVYSTGTEFSASGFDSFNNPLNIRVIDSYYNPLTSGIKNVYIEFSDVVGNVVYSDILENVKVYGDITFVYKYPDNYMYDTDDFISLVSDSYDYFNSKDLDITYNVTVNLDNTLTLDYTLKDRVLNTLEVSITVDVYQKIEGLEYILIDGFAYISNYTKDLEILNIPGIIDGYIVKGIESISNSNVKEIYLPKSIQTVKYIDCFNLEGIYVSSNNLYLDSIDGILCSKDFKQLILYPINKQGESYTVSSNFITISDYAFKNNLNLKSITINNNIKQIGAGILQNTSIISLSIYDIDYLGSLFNASSYLENPTYIPNTLKDVYLTSMTVVKSYTFYKAQLDNIYISNSLIEIKEFAFSEINNTNIFISKAKVQLIIGDNYNPNNNPIYFNVIEILENDEYRYLISDNQITLLKYLGTDTHINIPTTINGIEVKTIGMYVFSNNTNITKMIVGNNITKFNLHCFYGLVNLDSLLIPNLNIYMDETRLSYLGALFNFKTYLDNQIPNTLKTLEITNDVYLNNYALYKASNLEKLILGETLTQINSYALSECYKLIVYAYAKNLILENNANINQRPIYFNIDNIYTFNNYEYIIIDNRITLTKYLGNESSVLIPTEIEGIIVDSIGDYCFQNTTSINSMDIGLNITYIGNGMLSGCYNISEITLPFVGNSSNSLFGYIFGSLSYDFATSVNQYYSLTSYRSYYIPNNLRKITVLNQEVIGFGAFYNLSSIEVINLASNLEEIQESAFYNCHSLREINIPTQLHSIHKKAFYNCYQISRITIPATVTTIGEYAFYNCHSLSIYCELDKQSESWDSRWNFSNRPVYYNVTEIYDNDDFLYLIENNEVRITSYIGNNEHVVIPSEIDGYKVTKVSNNVFLNNTTLISVVIPKEVNYIGQNIFSGCSNLESITIPFIGQELFSEIKVLGYLFGQTNYPNSTRTTQYYSLGGQYSYYIPNSLYKVIITSEVELGYGAFYNCSNISSIYLNDTLEKINSRAFENCTSLTQLYIYNSTKQIDNVAFNNCHDLIIYAQSETASWHSNFNPNNRPVYYGVSDIIENDDYIYFLKNNKACITKYKNSEANIVLPNKIDNYPVYRLGSKVFSDPSIIISLTIGNNFEYIDGFSLYGCSNIQTLSIPFVGNNKHETNSSKHLFGYIFGTTSFNNATAIRQYYSLDGHITYYIPSTLKEVTLTYANKISYGAFYGCSSLEKIYLNKDIITIGSYVFTNCALLTIYAEIDKQPSGWDPLFNSSFRPVIYSFKFEN